MEAIITQVKNGTRFYLTAEDYATDTPSRARVFRDLTDATLTANHENLLPEWSYYGFGHWVAGYRMSDGTIVIKD